MYNWSSAAALLLGVLVAVVLLAGVVLARRSGSPIDEEDWLGI